MVQCAEDPLYIWFDFRHVHPAPVRPVEVSMSTSKVIVAGCVVAANVVTPGMGSDGETSIPQWCRIPAVDLAGCHLQKDSLTDRAGERKSHRCGRGGGRNRS